MTINYENTAEQGVIYSSMMRKPVMNKDLAARVWAEQVYALRGRYTMHDE
jgi:hypothetical protein